MSLKFEILNTLFAHFSPPLIAYLLLFLSLLLLLTLNSWLILLLLLCYLIPSYLSFFVNKFHSVFTTSPPLSKLLVTSFYSAFTLSLVLNCLLCTCITYHCCMNCSWIFPHLTPSYLHPLLLIHLFGSSPQQCRWWTHHCIHWSKQTSFCIKIITIIWIVQIYYFQGLFFSLVTTFTLITY